MSEASECSEDGTRDKDQCWLAILQRPPQERDWVWRRWHCQFSSNDRHHQFHSSPRNNPQAELQGVRLALTRVAWWHALRMIILLPFPFRISNPRSKIILTHLQYQHWKPILQCRLAILQRGAHERVCVWKWSGQWLASPIPLAALLPQNPIYSSSRANRQEKMQVAWLGTKEQHYRDILSALSSSHPPSRMSNSGSKKFLVWTIYGISIETMQVGWI